MMRCGTIFLLQKCAERSTEVNFTEKNSKRIRLIAGIATSILLVITGILFIISCYSIYKTGASPFTRESIAQAFAKIAIPVWITVAMIIFDAIVCLLIDEDEPKLKGKRTDTVVLDKLKTTKDVSDSEEVMANVAKEEGMRRILGYVNAALIALGSTLPLIYLLNPANFPAISGEYNSEIARGMLVYLAALTPVFIYEIIYVILFDRSVKREIELYRSLPAAKLAGNLEKTEKTGGVLSKISALLAENEKDLLLGARIALVICGVSFVIAGVLNGGMSDVLQKAIKICTECIGLG